MAEQYQGRKAYLENNQSARAWARMDHALNQQQQVTPGPVNLKEDSFVGKRAVIVGSGVAGLTAAYELLAKKTGMEVIVLEAHNRTGGRCLTLRTGDTLTEDKDSQLHGSTPGETQVVRFERPVGDSEPYLNAGPGRIPSSHKRLLNYLREFGVEVEVYVMASGSNMTQVGSDGNNDAPFGGHPVVNRRLANNTRGWISEMVFQNAESLLQSSGNIKDGMSDEEKQNLTNSLQSLMVSFGSLTSDGRYCVSENEPGQDDGASDRAGYSVLPGVDPGEVAEAIGLNTLLDSGFWEETRFYQPEDFLWQPTLFQPVGGMDRVQHAFAQQIATLGAVVHLNSPVTSIDWDESKDQFVISADGHSEPFTADYCFCNCAIPFLKSILSDKLQDSNLDSGFTPEFKNSLHAVYEAQFNQPVETQRFLACTTKVGWQADRSLWQGKPIVGCKHDGLCDAGEGLADEVLAVDQSEVGVVPIYGGISWTNDQITQIWYPSNAYHDVKGTLTGCYNFGSNANTAGKQPVQERLEHAREGAKLFGQEFGDGLQHGVAIAWQNMPFIKGGWAQWQYVDDGVNHYNEVIQGTGINGSQETRFFIVGDQVSSLPGWQEGAIASALNAVSRLARPDLQLPRIANLPDTQVIVEGI